MKKVLLGTSALVGAVLVSQAALAEAPKVTVGGFSEFQAGIVGEDNDTALRNHGFRSDNEISFKVNGRTDSGLGYGAEIWLEADVTDDADAQGTNASKTFVYLEGAWGRFEGGSNLGADQTLKVDASSIARATGGIDGDWYYFVNQGTTANQIISTPDLPINYGFSAVGGPALGNEAQENLNKVTYYTPRWYGFQAGLSYSVDTDDRGQNVTLADNTAGQFENIWQGGINYTNQWDQWGLGLSATAESGDAESNLYEDLWAWALGAKVSYMGFSVAASYGDWDDSGALKAPGGNDDSHYWTIGGAYEYGPFGVSVTYLDSEYDVAGVGENEFDNLSIGADYKLAPGLTPYAEISFFDQNAVGGGLNDNDGTVFILGTALNF